MPKLIYATMIVGNKNVAQNKKLESRSTGTAALFSGMEGEVSEDGVCAMGIESQYYIRRMS